MASRRSCYRNIGVRYSTSRKFHFFFLLAAFTPVDFTQKNHAKNQNHYFYVPQLFVKKLFAGTTFSLKTVNFRKKSIFGQISWKKTISGLQPSRAEAKPEGVCLFKKNQSKNLFLNSFQRKNFQLMSFRKVFSLKTVQKQVFWLIFFEKTDSLRLRLRSWRCNLILSWNLSKIDFCRKLTVLNEKLFRKKVSSRKVAPVVVVSSIQSSWLHAKKNQNHYFFCRNFSWSNFCRTTFSFKNGNFSKTVNKFHEKVSFRLATVTSGGEAGGRLFLLSKNQSKNLFWTVFNENNLFLNSFQRKNFQLSSFRYPRVATRRSCWPRNFSLF